MRIAAIALLALAVTACTSPASSDDWFPADACVAPVDGSQIALPERAEGSFAGLATETLQIGVAASGNAASDESLDRLSADLGESPAIVMEYFDFRQPAPLDTIRRFAGREITMMVSWEPWQWGEALDQPAFRTAAITRGDFDDYLTAWGVALASWDGPVLLRFGHEMNTETYPWSDLTNGNAAGNYAAAWRHVHDVVESAGATEILWVWSPNVPVPGSQPFAESYPGDAYVDVVAIDGYNWGASQSWSSWTSPCDLFASGLEMLRSIAPGRPIVIAETGSAEEGGDKAAWNRQLITYLSAQPDVFAVVLFNQDKEIDWRIASSPASLAAFAAALEDRGRPDLEP
jgi:beta-mannanase